MRQWRKALVAGAVGLAVLVPSGVAMAATAAPGNGPSAVTATCTGDHQMQRLHDGTGWQHMSADRPEQAAAGHQHMSGPQDGSGPQADRPLDGSGHQWRSGS